MDAAPRLIELPEVTRITSLKKTSIYERVKLGEFRAIKLGTKTVFSEAEIAAWVTQQLTASATSLAPAVVRKSKKDTADGN